MKPLWLVFGMNCWHSSARSWRGRRSADSCRVRVGRAANRYAAWLRHAPGAR